jgi:hypothetical protein
MANTAIAASPPTAEFSASYSYTRVLEETSSKRSKRKIRLTAKAAGDQRTTRTVSDLPVYSSTLERMGNHKVPDSVLDGNVVVGNDEDDNDSLYADL